MTINIAVSVSLAGSSKFKPNKHGLLPVVLSPLNGLLPANSGVLDGSLAERMGIMAGQRYVLSISLTGYYTNPTTNKTYPNYQYTVITHLGAAFEQMVASQVVASMNFGFATPVAPVAPTAPTQPEFETPEPVEEAPEEVQQTVTQ